MLRTRVVFWLETTTELWGETIKHPQIAIEQRSRIMDVSKLTEEQMMDELLKYNSPTVTNIVATYPEHPHCLGLYDSWYGKWYTDQTVHCMFPEMGRRVGYVSTVVFSLPDPDKELPSFTDWIDALDKAKKPTIVVAQQDFPPEIAPAVGLFGGQMTSLLKTMGVTGVITNGPSRDLDELRDLGIQYFMTGTCAGHGDFVIKAIDVPVSVAGMDVAPGDMVHMDEHGGVKLPADKLADVCEHIGAFSDQEDKQVEGIFAAKNVEEIKKAWVLYHG